jgi:hypothetical protein
MKTKFAIGCLIQWYEVDIIGEYIETLKEAIDEYEGEVIVDFLISSNTQLEKPTSEEDLSTCISSIEAKLVDNGFETFDNWDITGDLVTIADYRREFNEKYCEQADVLIWGESDMLVPKQAFVILDHLHQNSPTPKYLATFGICKMWDDSWKPLEHPDFTDKPFIEMDTENWWSLRYVMSKDEMNKINEKVNQPEVYTAPKHKFNGCGLVISSEVIKSGVNIPRSVFFVHEDTAFMLMTQKVLGNIPQYIIKNILVVHNRKHPKKRYGVKGEETIDKTDTGALRKAHSWYSKANKMCEQNCYNIFNPNYKSFTWKDVWK